MLELINNLLMLDELFFILLRLFWEFERNLGNMRMQDNLIISVAICFRFLLQKCCECCLILETEIR